MRINRKFGYAFILLTLLCNQLLITADKVPATVSSQLFAIKFPKLPKAPIPDNIPPVPRNLPDDVPNPPRNLPDDAPNPPRDGLEEPHKTKFSGEGSEIPVNTGSLDSQRLRSIANTATKQAETRSISYIFEQKVIRKAQRQSAAQVGTTVAVEIDPSLTIRNQVEEVASAAAMKGAEKKALLN